VPRAVGCRGRFRLDANHFHRGVDGLGDDARTGRAAAATDGHDDHVGARLVLKDFQGLGSDAGDQQRLVAGVHIAVAVVLCELLAVFACVVEVAPVDDQPGAQTTHRLDLDRVGVFGHADRCRHTEKAAA
jgi:hypothetical protein